MPCVHNWNQQSIRLLKKHIDLVWDIITLNDCEVSLNKALPHMWLNISLIFFVSLSLFFDRIYFVLIEIHSICYKLELRD